MRPLLAALVALGLCLCAGAAGAETRLWRFTADDVPQALTDAAAAVADESVTIRLTFVGDCTLGDEKKWTGHPAGFCAYAEKYGMAYPFQNLQALFAHDDLTVANLEGVLSDSGADRAKKTYNFRGGAALAGVLTAGSVECVSLANNHIRDYGLRGEKATKAALDAAGVGWFDENTLCVLEKDGARVGFTATLFTLGERKERALRKQMQLLRDLGCGAVIHVMHAGVEYKATDSGAQRTVARAAIDAGAALVVGHHPHIVQNAEVVSGAPVVYSLGNCCFGGNTDPSDKAALALGVEIAFEGGALRSLDWTLHPISVSGRERGNDYQPYLLGGAAAQAVIDRVRDVSATALEPYAEGEGARQKTIFYTKDGRVNDGSVD